MLRKLRDGDIGNSSCNNNEGIAASSAETTELDSVKKQLKEIHDLLQTRVHKEEQRCEDDKEDEMKQDWILAAAVVDRICAIAITFIFSTGTIVFCVLFFAHHLWSN